jgi:hypothetical protein
VALAVKEAQDGQCGQPAPQEAAQCSVCEPATGSPGSDFSPHPIRRPDAACTARCRAHIPQVSILIRSEDRMQPRCRVQPAPWNSSVDVTS